MTGDLDGDRTRAIAAAAIGCSGVAALSSGPFGTVATYLPDGRVEGVTVREGAVEVHIVTDFGLPLPELADRVRTAVHPLATGRDVLVVVDDLT